MRLRAFGATDSGRRATNEDRFVCEPEQGVFVVADGVGGYAAGEVAAEIACDLLVRRLAGGDGIAGEQLREAITEANNAIYRCSLGRPDRTGMACVLTAVVVAQGRATVGHVGDTRLYVVRDGAIRKVTRDHAIVGLMEDAGLLSEAEAMRHPRRNEILRDVGSQPRTPEDEGFVECHTFVFEPGTSLVLCSDGLSDVVPSAEIGRVVQAHAGDVEAAARALVQRAREAGGEDNITVVVLRA